MVSLYDLGFVVSINLYEHVWEPKLEKDDGFTILVAYKPISPIIQPCSRLYFVVILFMILG